MRLIKRISRRAHNSVGFNNPYEKEACKYLEKQGLSLVRSNYSCRYGEIDLVMQHNSCLVFIEVRFRKNSSFGTAIDSVTSTKQEKLIITAQHYLQHERTLHADAICRFDVIGVSPLSASMSPAASSYAFQWVKDAFCT